MQHESTERSEQNTTSNNPSTSSSPNQYGSVQYEANGLYRVHSGGSSSVSSQSTRRDSDDGIDADQLDERLRGLSLRAIKALRHPAPGQRISDYENALTPPTPRQALGFKVIKRSGGDAGDGVQLADIPNGQFSSPGGGDPCDPTCPAYHRRSQPLTWYSRNLDECAVVFAPRLASIGCSCLEAILCSCYDPAYLAPRFSAIFPRSCGS